MADEIRIPAAQLGDGERHTVELDGRRVTVFNVDGRFVAYHDRCAHQGGPVCTRGTLHPYLTADVGEDGEAREYFKEGATTIACPWHGWEFDLATGASLADPRRRLRPARVARDGDELVIGL
jgi:nitrite reductase (NADH) small subunit